MEIKTTEQIYNMMFGITERKKKWVAVDELIIELSSIDNQVQLLDFMKKLSQKQE